MMRGPRNLLPAFLTSVTLMLAVMAFHPKTLFSATFDFVNTGFQDYSLGNLEGQKSSDPNQWLFSGGSSTATVQTAGTNKYVSVNRAANSDDRWAIPGFITPLGYIEISWKMNVTQRFGSGFGPFFGCEAYDANPDPYLLGSLGVDATTGDVLYQATGSGNLTETGTKVAFGTWNDFRVLLNYNTHEYSTFLNGSFLASAGFVDGGLVAGNLKYFTDADISALAAGADPASQAATGTAGFDNFLVRTLTYVPSSIWNKDSDGSWSVGSNWWTNAPSSSPSSGAGFWDIITAPRTVTLDVDSTVGTLQFYSNNKYTIAGNKILTLAGVHTIEVIEGSHEISTTIAGSDGLIKTGPGTLTLSGLLTYTGDTQVLAGTLDVIGSINTPANNILVSGSATLKTTSIHANSLTIGSSGVATVPEPSTFLMLILAGSAMIGYFRRR